MIVTLETLRADYNAAIAERDRVYADPNSSRGAMLKSLMDGYWPFHIYDIARNYGLQAAMLFKLSDGAIDPRVQP